MVKISERTSFLLAVIFAVGVIGGIIGFLAGMVLAQYTQESRVEKVPEVDAAKLPELIALSIVHFDALTLQVLDEKVANVTLYVTDAPGTYLGSKSYTKIPLKNNVSIVTLQKPLDLLDIRLSVMPVEDQQYILAVDKLYEFTGLTAEYGDVYPSGQKHWFIDIPEYTCWSETEDMPFSRCYVVLPWYNESILSESVRAELDAQISKMEETRK